MNFSWVGSILPELVLTAGALLLLLGDVIHPRQHGMVLGVGIASVITALVVLVKCPVSGLPSCIPLPTPSLLAADGLSRLFKILILISVGLVFLMSGRFQPFQDRDLTPYGVLLLFSAVGMMFLVSGTDFLILFIAIELIGVTSFILTGYLRHDRRSSEAALKFFLIGAFSSAMLVYGISWLYGLSGSTNLGVLAQWAVQAPEGMQLVLFVALLLVLVGFGFKMSLVPFHMWVPDIFEGAPTPITAYLSVAPKIAAMAAAVRVFLYTFPHPTFHVSLLLAVLSALTMTVGNIVAIQQDNVKRLLAYSSIAHMGYLFMGVVAGTPFGQEGVYLYALAYLVMNLGAFAVVVVVSNAVGSDQIAAYRGLAQRSLGLALVLAVFLLSLGGIPPFIGFLGKFYIFASAIQSGWIWLAVVAILNSVIAIYYYFRLTFQMYFQPPLESHPLPIPWSHRLLIAGTAGCTILLGIFPQPIIASAQWLSQSLRAG
ncbi:MAG: NADH-quinone oxidoreductase subunit N [Elusimicrobia bacterium]|nr:NADH-quinone oxidoreductase subunit N [Elusimicrobiota bacterium]